jgi:hypothetical protein
MAFGFGRTEISVLEAKFSIYEDLSKEMLDKLERAVVKISESNQKVGIILERHETRLEQAVKTDNLIVKMIEDLKNNFDSRIKIIENKVEDYGRIKWMIVGMGIFSAVMATAVSTLASGWLTPGQLGYRMEHRYVPAPENVTK